MRFFIGISLALHTVVLITGGTQLTGTPFTGTPVSVVLRPVAGESSLPDTSEQVSTPHMQPGASSAIPVPASRIRALKTSHAARTVKQVKETAALSSVAATLSDSTLHQRNSRKPDAKPAANTGDLLSAELQAMFAANFSYPSIARRNNWEGNVLAAVRVEEDGTLSHIKLVKTSGYNVLDDATLQGLRNISALPSAQGWLKGHHFDIVMPVQYRLVSK